MQHDFKLRYCQIRPNGERERAIGLVCYLAGRVRFETISDLE